MSGLSRRRFLGLGAALTSTGMLAGCATVSGAQAPVVDSVDTGFAAEPLRGIEKPDITVGFIPITCASPIVNAAPLGIYAKHGLNVTLKKFSGWAEVWGAYATGEIQATHMLAPMPLAIHNGLASGQTATRLPLLTNSNGQAITLALEHRDRVHGPEDMARFVLGIPFDYSMHNLLLRHYLSTGGVDPDTDVELRVMRPADMVANLVTGNIDGYLAPDPFNQRAVAIGAGYLHVLTRDLWNGHPCCSFAVRDDFAAENPVTYRALTRAVVDAALWSNDPGHRAAAARSMAAESYLNQNPELLTQVLTGEFPDGTGRQLSVPDRIRFSPYPYEAMGVWMLSQFQRWGLVPEGTFTTAESYRRSVRPVFDTTTAATALTDLGSAPPQWNPELIMGSLFDPSDPTPWTAKQVKV
ncbi:CmpA/NrtA family ABC transporter substrate-binding protein [Rhodococcus sp. HNM0569]|uniref:ABC transporter substrate-binding protein n=1 Tax=Rhodococcus sp. HNM0569 TaxID=2716340 RepID=UPI00146CE9FE|nr:ABC transporter substrate-binding protein [Rhodococcus sp. HNM0569]